MARSVWVVEFLHSMGWTPVEAFRDRRDAWRKLRYWRERCPHFEHRATKYIPAKPTRAGEKRKR